MKRRMYNTLVLTTLELMMFCFQVLCWTWIFRLTITQDFTKDIIIFLAVIGIVISVEIKREVERRIKNEI